MFYTKNIRIIKMRSQKQILDHWQCFIPPVFIACQGTWKETKQRIGIIFYSGFTRNMFSFVELPYLLYKKTLGETKK